MRGLSAISGMWLFHAEQRCHVAPAQNRASVSMTYRPAESVRDDGVQRLTRTARDRHFVACG